MARHRRTRGGRWALGTALAATVACAGGAGVAAFGVFDGTPPRPARPTSRPRSRPSRRGWPVIPGRNRWPVRRRSDPYPGDRGERAGHEGRAGTRTGPCRFRRSAEHNLAGWYQYGPAPGQRGAGGHPRPRGLAHRDLGVLLPQEPARRGQGVRDPGRREGGRVRRGRAAEGGQGRVPDRVRLRQGRLPEPAADHLRRPVRQVHRALPGQHHRLRPPGQG